MTSSFSYFLLLYWTPSTPMRTLGLIWLKRSTMLGTPKSGEQLDQTAPRLEVASKPTTASGIFGTIAATRSPFLTPIDFNEVAMAEVSRESSPQEIDLFSPFSFRKIITVFAGLRFLKISRA